MKKRLQNGFAHPAMVLMLLVIVAITLIGYKVVQNHNKASLVSTGTSSSVATQTIKTSADLNTAQNSLNSQNIDNDLNPSGYNQDVSSLL